MRERTLFAVLLVIFFSTESFAAGLGQSCDIGGGEPTCNATLFCDSVFDTCGSCSSATESGPDGPYPLSVAGSISINQCCKICPKCFFTAPATCVPTSEQTVYYSSPAACTTVVCYCPSAGYILGGNGTAVSPCTCAPNSRLA